MVGTLTIIIQVKCKGRFSLMAQKPTKAHEFIISFITHHGSLTESTLLRGHMPSRKDLWHHPSVDEL